MYFDIGIEKEYNVCIRNGNKISYLLASEFVVNNIILGGLLPQNLNSKLNDMIFDGWRIFPEYSKTIIEIVSPSFSCDKLNDLQNGFDFFEEILNLAAKKMKEINFFLEGEVFISDKFPSTSNLFIDLNGKKENKIENILLNKNDFILLKNLVYTANVNFSEIFDVNFFIMLWCSFASTHVTFYHEKFSNYSKYLFEENEFPREFIKFYFKSLFSSIMIDSNVEKSNYIYNEQKDIIYNLNISSRDFLLNNFDINGKLAKNYSIMYSESRDNNLELNAFYEIFGNGPFSDKYFKSFNLYAARPRLYGLKMMLEYRCFHSGISVRDCLKLSDIFSRLLE